MKKLKFIVVVLLIVVVAACNNKVKNDESTNMKEIESKISENKNNNMEGNKVVKTDEQWKKELSPEQYYVLRQKGTERPHTGALLNHKEDGLYTCAACGNELFKSEQKFDSHCGWPSFDDQIEGAINTTKDSSHGMIRTEITCAKCDGHLGHIFDDGPTETGLRYCVNSLSIGFKKDTVK